jgi:hypothetical protein
MARPPRSAPVGVLAPNVGASWVIDTDLTPNAMVGFTPAAPGQLPPFGRAQWYVVGRESGHSCQIMTLVTLTGTGTAAGHAAS